MQSKQYKSGFIEVNEFNLPAMSEEEIKKFELEEGLTELDKAKILLKKKNTAQMVSVLVNLPILFREGPDAIEALLPDILKDVGTWEEKLQVEAGEAFLAIMEAQKQLFATTLSMLKIWSAEVAARWSEVLRLVVKALPAAATHAELESLLLSLSDISQPHGSRIVAAELIGIMAEVMPAAQFMGKPFERALSLCQDFNWEVRRRIASKLTLVCSKVGTQAADEHLYKELSELIDDQEVEVEIEAMKAWVESLPVFSPSLLASQGTKVVASLLESQHPQIKDLLVQHCGQIIHGLSYQTIAFDEVFDKGELLRRLLALIEEYAKFKNAKHQRELVASNLPALTLLLPDELYVEKVLPILVALSKIDSSLMVPTVPDEPLPLDDVRNRLAAGFHEVLRLKGVEWVVGHKVDEILFTLLEEGKSTVVAAVIAHLNEVLLVLRPDPESETQTSPAQIRILQSLLKILPKIYTKLTGNWRAQTDLFSNLRQAMDWLPPEQQLKVIQTLHVPSLHTAVEPVKQLISHSLCQILASTAHYHLRNFIHQHITKEFALSRSYRDRFAFLDFCLVAQGYLSKQYFKVSFLNNLLELTKDKVVGVLIKFCLNIKAIRKWIATDDAKNSEKFDKALRDMEKLARGLKMQRVVESVENARAQIEHPAFEDELANSELEESARQQKEHELHRSEKKAMELQKKKEIEEMVQQGKNQYLSAVNMKNKSTKSSSKITKGIPTDLRPSKTLTSKGLTTTGAKPSSAKPSSSFKPATKGSGSKLGKGKK